MLYFFCNSIKNLYWVKSEAKEEKSYSDLLLTPRNTTKGKEKTIENAK